MRRVAGEPAAPEAAPPRPAPRWTARRLALGWAVLTLAVAAITAPAQGVGRDEGVYLVAARSYAGFWAEAARDPAGAPARADAHFVVNHEHPPFAKTVYGATRALLAGALGWTGDVQGARYGAFLFAALLSALLALTGAELAGRAGALLAPALFWAVPRHFYHAHPAALDLPVTTLWLATVLAYRRSLAPAAGAGWARLGRFGPALVAGLAFGAALATKHNAWFLWPVLALHAAVARLLPRPAGAGPRGRAWPAVAAMAVLGPLVLVASWPWLWRAPVQRLTGYLAFHLHHENYPWLYLGRVLREPPFPVAYPLVLTALTVPAAILVAYAGGVFHGAARMVRAVRAAVGRPAAGDVGPGARPLPSGPDELLLLLNALVPIAIIGWPTVPHFGGVKHWLPAMPFLALLGARVLVSAARTVWPERAGLLAGALGALAVLPGAWAVARVHPYGTAAYNEVAGAAPGAAMLGMQRQFWGDDAVGLLERMNAHAAPGARVWWQETTRLAVEAWQHDGKLRADLRWADGPEGADLAIWQFHQEWRDREYRTWTAFAEPTRPREPPRYPRPVAGVYLEEVPLAVVYARPGAWR